MPLDEAAILRRKLRREVPWLVMAAVAGDACRGRLRGSRRRQRKAARMPLSGTPPARAVSVDHPLPVLALAPRLGASSEYLTIVAPLGLIALAGQALASRDLAPLRALVRGDPYRVFWAWWPTTWFGDGFAALGRGSHGEAELAAVRLVGLVLALVRSAACCNPGCTRGRPSSTLSGCGIRRAI